MGDGFMLRDHLKSEERQTRRFNPRLHQSCPKSGQYVWDWFRELSAARQPGPAGPAPLSFSEIDAWSRLRAHDVTSREVAIIRALDSLFLEIHYG